MEALNIEAEYRRNKEVTGADDLSIEDFVHNKITSGQWIEDDGDYYTREEWNANEALNAYTADDSFRSWLDETEPEDPDADQVTVGGITYDVGDFDR